VWKDSFECSESDNRYLEFGTISIRSIDCYSNCLMKRHMVSAELERPVSSNVRYTHRQCSFNTARRKVLPNAKS